MSKYKLTYLPVLAIIALSACNTTPSPGTPEAKAQAIVEQEKKAVEAVEQTVGDIPDWCLQLPTSDFALYACGSGESGSLNMSRTRATLDAKRQLADMIDSEISSRMEDFLSSTGTSANEQILQQSEIITKNVTIEASLTGYKQMQSEAQAVGSKFLVYTLLEYPIGQANQALVNKIKENEILITQEAADEALAELEAEIEKKRNE